MQFEINAFLLFVQFPFTTQISAESYQQPLVTHIFKNYSKELRPLRTNKKPINVTIGIEFIQILSVDERSQCITLKTWMRMRWVNELLQWNPKNWNNISVLKVSPDTIWKPDIMLYGEVNNSLPSNIESFKNLAYLYANGDTLLSSPTMFTSSCNIDVTYFPFDQQTCFLKYASWGYDESELDIHVSVAPFLSGHYIKHMEWDITELGYKRNSVKYSMHSQSWPDITVSFKISRKPLFYVLHIIVPCVILITVVLISFCLPTESGKRPLVIAMVVLAFTVNLNMVSEFLPSTSDSIPLLSIFSVIIIAESSFTLALTSIVLIIYYRGSEKGIRPLPKWMNIWFNEYAAKKLGVVRSSGKKQSIAQSLSLEKRYIELVKSSEDLPLQDDGISSLSEENESLNKLLKQMKVITQLIHHQSCKDKNKEDWHLTANVIDRLLCIMCFALFLGTSVVILIPGDNSRTL